MRRALSSPKLPVALLASVALHVAVAALAFAPRAVAAPDPPTPDVWAGTSVELLTEADLASPSLPSSPSSPSSPDSQGQPADPAAPAAEPPAATPPAEPRAPDEARPPRQTPKEPKEPKAPKEPRAPKEPKEPGKKAAADGPHEPPQDPPDRKPEAPVAKPITAKPGIVLPSGMRIPPRLTPTRPVQEAAEDAKNKETKGSKSPAGEAPGASAAASAAPAGGSFGAVGAAQVRDLGASFTRAVAPAGQPDLSWGALPVGDGGTLEVALDVDEEGKIKGFTPKSAAPPAHLVGLVKRVLAVLRSGHFSIRGPAASAGVQVLRISAKISDLVDPGLIQGGLVQLAYTFENGKGHSSFTQVTGRHVEVNVEVRKVEVAGAK